MNTHHYVLAGTALLAVSAAGMSSPVNIKSDKDPAATRWAFRTPVKPPVPSMVGAKTPIDAFLLEKLHAKCLTFAPPADRRTAIRRLSFDLTGLPPSPELLALPYDAAVDRLLASRFYGERWGRHWLDVVRFGETDGGEHNFERFNAWPYRDYVINALNQDVPYDQFVREQIAGDVLFPGDRDKLAATGFLVSGPWDQVSAVLNKDPVQRKMARMDELDDMVTTTSATFLGLTVNCARCHDHKFDPIPTRDYYRMTAAFSGAGFGERSVASADEQAKYDAQVKPLKSELSRIESELSGIEDGVSARLLAVMYRQYDEGRWNEPRRIPLNGIYNREAFPPVTARWFRLAVNAQVGGRPRIERLKLLPVGHEVRDWKGSEGGQSDRPAILTIDLGAPKAVSEIVWSTNTATPDRDGMPNIYRFEASEDGTTWRKVAANTDHISKLEQDLPDLPEEELAAALTPENREKRRVLRKRMEEIQNALGAIPSPARIYAATTHKPEPAFLLERGSVQKQKEQVTPGALSSVTQLTSQLDVPSEADDGQRRLALAKWITDRRNPLTARVIVNRVWYYHFGAGIVNTPSDFGANGDKPSHPELLDWLASSFMEHGWSLKWLHREILLTQAYRQSSHANSRAMKVDAGNRLLWRMPLRRMDAETLRDSLLWLSGSLDTRMGGPSFPLHQKGARGSYIYHTLENDGAPVWRRAVYRFVVRGGDKTLLDSFDCPDPSVATPQRQSSNTPSQALALLNNRFVIHQAGLFAKRLEKEAATPLERVRKAYTLAMGRDATSAEISRGVSFAKSYSLAAFCRALVNSNEFVYTP